MAKILVDNEEVVKAAVSEANTYIERYRTQRKEIDDMNIIADYMYSCAQNRTIEAAEKTYGMNMDKDTRANVGSTLYHRIVNQLAAQLEAVMLSKPHLFKYTTYSRDGADDTRGGEDRAQMMQLLATWTLKEDAFTERIPQFTRMLFKRSNIFALVKQVREEADVTRKEPEYELITNPETGQIEPSIIGEKDVKETKIVKNHPSIVFPAVDSIFLDRFIGDMQQQPCVAIQSLKTKSDLYNGVVNEWYSEKQYDLLDDNHLWDGQTGREALKDKEDARNFTHSGEKQENLYLTWDVYIWLPIGENGKYDEEGEEPQRLYWMTLVGNTVGQALCLRLEENSEPDNEIPLKDIHVYPDDGDRMYHTTTCEICRSSYSADCTLFNLALDNMGLVNDPPLLVLDGFHNIKDFSFKKGARWPVMDLNAVKQMDIRNTTGQTNLMREYVRDGIMMAMNVDKNFVGESQGARTSASEATFINRNSMQPHLSQVRYILMQLLPWMAKKYMSYWQEYGDPDQVVLIADENKKYHRISPVEVDGEFDVKVEIIDEYESDIIKQQALEHILQIVASNEWLQKGAEEEVDGPALLKEIIIANKIDPSSIFRSISGGDSDRRAKEDIEVMLYGGQPVQVDPESNFNIHLRVKKQELARWKGVEKQAIEKGVRVDLLQQHVRELEGMMHSGGQQSNAAPLEQVSEPQGMLPGGEMTEGQMGAQSLGGVIGV